MTVRTPPPPRLPAAPPARELRGREVRTGLLALLGLLVVLVGVPVGLVLAVGNPLPTSVPSRDWLVADVSATLIIDVLAVVLWIAWAHFAVCVIAEWAAARRGRGLPSEVPFGGGSQLVARRLVAAALLLAGAATLVPSSSGGPVERPAAVTAVQDTTAAAPAEVTAAEAAVTSAGPAAAAQGETKTYVVQPPDGRRYDSLWDIAERTLGDPFRYREIYELNRDRQQADGRVLADADLIHPGWVLRLPADAAGPGVVTPALTPAVPAPSAPADPAPQEAAVDPAAPEAGGASGAVAPSVDAGTPIDQLALGGGLLAAGLLVALTARRGPYAPPTDAPVEQELRLAAAPGRAALLDRGLRTLAARCAAEGRSLPEVVLATCSDEEVVLSVVGQHAEPPAPWRTVADGRGWALSAAALGDEPTPAVAAPYPALAGIGVSDGVDVLVDLEAAPGLVAIGGDRLVAREVVTSLVVELATNLWSDGVAVTAVVFGDDLTSADPCAVTAADRLDDVLGAVEQEARSADAALQALGVDGVLSGRLVRTAGRRRPRVLVLSGPPTPEESARLTALVRETRTPLAVVCVGDAPDARWRFSVDAEGTLDLGLLGVRTTARRLRRDDCLPLLALLRDADTERKAETAAVAGLTPRAALTEATAPGAAALPAPTGLSAAEVRLLGPLTVFASGQVDPAARPLLTEVVVAVALHRTSTGEGLHEASLRSMVWPRGVGDDVLAATLEQVQAWLGTTATGLARLHRDDEGRWALTGDVHCDLDVLRTAAAAPDGSDQEQALLSGLATVRGEAFSAVPADRYGWLPFHRAARDARVLGTAVARRAAALAVGRADSVTAARTLRTGLTLVPTAEPLWRDLLRLTGSTDPAACRTVARQLYAALAARGLPAEPETDALVQQLAPGADVRSA